MRASFRSFGLLCAAVAFLLALAVIFGWLFKVPLLVAGLPHLVPAHLLSALAASVLLASVLLSYSGRAGALVMAVSIAMTIFSALALAGILGLLFPPIGSPAVQMRPELDPGQMAPNSVICLLLSSVALIVYSRPGAKRSITLAQFLSLGTLTISLLALIGYAYSVEPFYGIGAYRAMSLPGSFMYLLLGSSLFFRAPDYGLTRILITRGAAGVLSRRLYLAAMIVPAALGFISVLGATVWDQYDLPFSVALVVVASMLLFSAVIAMTSRTIERADLSRLRAEEDLRHSRERLRELSHSIQVMQEDERIRIAREVHDELGQSLTAVKMDMSLLRAQSQPGSDLDTRMKAVVELVNGTLRTVQRITSELRPSILDTLGLAAAIEWQATEFEKRFGISCELNIPDEYLPVTADIATATFRIFQETLTNVARHAHATEVSVTLEERTGELHLVVHDNGVGLEREALERPQSFGVMGMRERAQLVNGHVEILSALNEGTTVRVTIPLPESLEEDSVEEATNREE